jgi:hypothetical protein
MVLGDDMIKVGKEPYLECSSKGAKHFSAFYAKINGRSIEDIYQAAKIFEDGSTGLGWREAKGKVPTNIDEVHKLYVGLWRTYILDNPYYWEELKNASGLSDMFGQEGHVCQATALWEIREEL